MSVLPKGRGLATALLTMTVREQHPLARSHHKVATSMQIHLAVGVGFELATDCILPIGY